MYQGENLPEFRFLGYTLDAGNRKLTDPGGEPVQLSSRAFDTLLTLVKNQGKTLSKAELMAAVWSSTVVEENNLNQAIFTLRRALGDSTRTNRFIRTISGRGYCFVAPVEVLTPDDHPEPRDAAPAEKEIGLRSWLPWRGPVPRKLLYATNLGLLILAVGAFVAPGLRSSAPPTAGMVVTGYPEPSVAATAMDAAHDSNKNTIAVLPFTSPELNKEQQLFAIGLHDEVISQLSKIRSLRVIARNSILSLVNQGYSTEEIAALLNVGSIVSGSTLFTGDHARIILSMHDADSGITRWSGNYEVDKQDLTEMFSVQSDIAINLAQALEAEILQREQERITRVPTRSVDAYRYYLSARIAHYKQDFANEWHWAKQAIELDPDFYDAHALFSSVNTVLISNPLPGMDSKTHFSLGLDSAETLINLDPRNSRGYALKAIALSTNRDWDDVFRIVDRFLDGNAPLADLNYLAIILLNTGDFGKAIEIYRANLQTEPFNLYGRGFLMVALELSGQREASRREYLEGEALSDFWWGDIVNVFLALGRGETIEDIDEMTSLSETHRNTLKKINARQDITQDLLAFRQTETKVSAEAVHYAALAAYAGERELAVEFMRASLQDNWTALFWAWLPVFDEVRQTEGFRAILAETGLVEQWRKSGWPEVCQPQGDTFSCGWAAYREPW